MEVPLAVRRGKGRERRKERGRTKGRQETRREVERKTETQGKRGKEDTCTVHVYMSVHEERLGNILEN